MGKQKPEIKPGNLKPFFPFAEMPPEYVIIAANFAKSSKISDGEILIDQNSEDPNDYFLLDGALTVVDVYGTESTLTAGTPEAAQPLPQPRPSSFRILGKGSATLIGVPHEVIVRVQAEAPEKDSLEEEVELDITHTREFFYDFKEELQMNRVRLPSLALSASRVRGLLTGGAVTKADIVAAVSMDPAIAAKLLKMANSALFNGRDTVQDLPNIVTRLGAYSTREIAACFAFRDVYKNAPKELVSRLEAEVFAARQVSAMSAAVAELTDNVDPNVAALAGLVHNIGVLPIFSYSMHNTAYALNPKLVDRAIEKMSHRTGSFLARKWRYGEEFVQCIEYSRDWCYPAGARPELVNVLITGQYHYELTKPGRRSLPKPTDVPSISAATGNRFDEKLSLQILSRAKEILNDRVTDRRAG